jgi:hypothetical protein
VSEERELIERLVRLLDAYDRSSMSVDRGIAQSLAQRRRRALDRAEEYLARTLEDR